MKRFHLPPAMLLALLVLGGCSTVQEWMGSKKSDLEPAKLAEFAETAKFKIRWHADLGDSGASLLQPALAGDAIYGVSGKGELTRVERATGKVVWRIECGIAVSGGVGSGEGLVLVGGNKGEVLAFGEDGVLRWKSRVSSEVLSAPQAAEGVVIVRSGDGRIAGLNAADGKRVWLYERSTPALVVRSHAGVTLLRDVALAGFAGGKLVAIKIKDGSVLREASVSQPRGSTELERISDITSDPVADDEQVCAIAFQGRVACYDITQGSMLWNRDIGSDKGMMLLRKYLYLSDSNGYVMALDKNSGGTVWKNEQLFMRGTSTPHASGNYVVVGDYEGYLHGLNREDGGIAARIKLDSTVRAAPMEMDEGLLVQTRGGGLYSLSIH
ncbi:MAG: outer membrane protein assembly factor BamB [Gallionellales bacterium RIFCSPLOWO2_12_FULL_59_22]|nr:MAG: outer membrane protein assembly factor BamB [Gallionellales bacterium RIFCSPLOWO2_02_FULL_59_110]OGT04632.1 MAG: outer membrane protein assembly factor BamB [Gallionellales bacterium RIFCSPLOWO2_02_58_13]OGT10367.1 MAG: outer membrane protein assembly factor BamB [Gallionellales bacterium RIFCSPLOWO2_12_FULL_59_22]